MLLHFSLVHDAEVLTHTSHCSENNKRSPHQRCRHVVCQRDARSADRMLCGVYYDDLLRSERDRGEGRKEDDRMRAHNKGPRGARLCGVRAGSAGGGSTVQDTTSGTTPWRCHGKAHIADTSQSREKKQSKIEQSGLSEEELLRQQEELFRSATEKFNAGPGE